MLASGEHGDGERRDEASAQAPDLRTGTPYRRPVREGTIQHTASDLKTRLQNRMKSRKLTICPPLTGQDRA